MSDIHGIEDILKTEVTSKDDTIRILINDYYCHQGWGIVGVRLFTLLVPKCFQTSDNVDLNDLEGLKSQFNQIFSPEKLKALVDDNQK